MTYNVIIIFIIYLFYTLHMYHQCGKLYQAFSYSHHVVHLFQYQSITTNIILSSHDHTFVQSYLHH